MKPHHKLIMAVLGALIGTVSVGIPIARAGTPTSGRITNGCPSDCGFNDLGGLGARKQQILGAGATILDLSVAMLETERMSTNYAYGDHKTGDSANFGLFKQNWGMLRTACPRFAGQGTNAWNNGAVLNSNLKADIECLHASQQHYGLDRWFASHRNGSAGLNNPNTYDIQLYRNCVYFTQNQLKANNANLSNDTRFWAYAKPI